MLRVISWLYSSRKWDRNRSILNNYKNQAHVLLHENLPDHNKITILGNTIEHATVVPDWFRRTKLCYEWYAGRDGGQCGGKAARHLCAEVNQMTKYYQDDTDDRKGGCFMRWGLFSSGYDDWFRNVKICYKWAAGGNRDQCGVNIPNTLCGSTNSYTRYYMDDSDDRAHGCKMQWMLSVPSNAPLWMQNAEICFEWYPDNDIEQCGGGAQRKLCARANSFTTVYLDDTDDRRGGCQMRWGIKVT